MPLACQWASRPDLCVPKPPLAYLVLAVSSARDSRGRDSRPAAEVMGKGEAEAFGRRRGQPVAGMEASELAGTVTCRE